MVRLLTPADAAAYVSLRRAMLLDTPWAFAASPENDRGSDVNGVAASLARAGYAIVGAFDEARLVSTGVLIRESLSKRAHIASVVSVYTAPEARRRGLGRQVLALLIEQARTWPGVATVALSVSANSPAARALYEQLGFVAWGTEPDALRTDAGSFAETYMRVSLS